MENTHFCSGAFIHFICYFFVLFRQRFLCACVCMYVCNVRVLLKIFIFLMWERRKNGTNVRGSCYGNYLFCHFWWKIMRVDSVRTITIVKNFSLFLWIFLSFQSKVTLKTFHCQIHVFFTPKDNFIHN